MEEQGKMLTGGVDALILDVGSNEMCEIIAKNYHAPARDKQFITDFVVHLISAACSWRDDQGVKDITFMTMLHMTHRTGGQNQRFTDAMSVFNTEMACRLDREPRISLRNHEGFDCREDGTAMPVHEWSPDGAHPGRRINHESFQKYIRNIRAAFNAAYSRLMGELVP